MNSRFSVRTRSLDYLPAARGICNNCDRLDAVTNDNLCSECSESVPECVICRREYKTSDGYEDMNVCPRCNPYYKKYINASDCFNAFKNDILSLYVEKKKQGMMGHTAVRDLFREIMKMVFNAKKTIG
jgi:hypothetical protein